MLVIVSDIHLTDGSSGQTIKSGAFEVFRERLRDLAYDASYRADGTYKPVERIDVLLLGDILDVIRSSKWCNGDLRPWSDTADPEFARRVAAINDDILGHNAESLARLKSLHDAKYISVPKLVDGKPATSKTSTEGEKRVPVDVRIFYMVGNHDWFYHLKGDTFDQIRRKAVDALGLANDPLVPFPHDPNESDEIQKALRSHAVFARHGDIYDGDNFDGSRDKSSLGDAVVVELLNKFPAEVALQFGGTLPAACLDGLKEIDNVRPQAMIPVWVHGLLKNTCNDQQRDAVEKVWKEVVKHFLSVPFVEHHNNRLKTIFSVSATLPLGMLTAMLRTFHFSSESPFYPNAFNEAAFKDLSAKFIVYGHTHHHEIIPLRVTRTPSGIVEQVYINSGTWRAVHDPAVFHPADEQFVGYHVMTYLAFFKDGERKGKKFESWSGALAPTD